MKVLRRLWQRLRDWWIGDLQRQRHAVEEDARRLGGWVMWNDR